MISLAILEDLAGTVAFQRGEEYFSMGAVRHLQATNGMATARVDGLETYQVELRDDDGELAYDCTCPRAADGYFCKHCVAVGLAWLAEQAGEVKLKKKGEKAKRRDPWRDIKNHLIAQPQEILIDLLILEIRQMKISCAANNPYKPNIGWSGKQCRDCKVWMSKTSLQKVNFCSAPFVETRFL